MQGELFLSRIGDGIWAAVREDGRTVELHVEHQSGHPRLGRIVKARVTRVFPAIQAAFLDVGFDRDAFIPVADLLLPGENAVHSEAHGPIQARLKPGQDVLVQITRESLNMKGDRATCWLSVPGRLLVLLPLSLQVGVSRRIVDPVERERLAAILRDLDAGRSGFVARTAACGAEPAELEAEAAGLLEKWHEIRRRAETALAPAVVHDEPPLAIRVLRSAPAGGFSRVVLDDPAQLKRVRGFWEKDQDELAPRIELYEGSEPLFAAHGLDQEIKRALRPRVRLPCGGYLVVEQTEALVSIDVNTGKSLHGERQEETSLATNLEAADEIARQLRLRNLGGIVVIDFVDMESEEHRQELVEAMGRALEPDPARTRIFGLSEIGLLQLTRKRTRSGLHATLTEACPTCGGQGWILQTDVDTALKRRQT